jgi:hypothetical protein
MGTDKVIETNEKIWHVKHDDSDSEDYDEQELRKLLCNDYAAFELSPSYKALHFSSW